MSDFSPTGNQYPAQPVTPPAQRLRMAVTRRADSDYIFSFWTALGWSVLTCGIFGIYVLYKQFQRSVEHNRRRIEVLDSATALAWERTVAAGRTDEFTPHFQHITAQVNVLRNLDGQFRDPALWTLIGALTGIGTYVGYVFLDQDLTAHEAAERSAEEQLSAVLGALGAQVQLPPAPTPKGQHNIVNRVIATIATCGVYALWWQYDLMVEGNANYRTDWAREDLLLVSLEA